MKSLIPFAFSFILTGCALFTGPHTDSSLPSKTTEVDKYADKNDLVMSRAAAAVITARVANQDGKSVVVENELSVAEAYLPRPSPTDLAEARSRATSIDSSVYFSALIEADNHQKQLDELWGKVEAEKQKAKDALEAKEKEYEAERKMLVTYAVVGVGSLGVAAGIAMMLLGFRKSNALSSIAVGLSVIAAATVFDAPWFGWVAAASILTFVIEAWRRLRCSKVNEPTPNGSE